MTGDSREGRLADRWNTQERAGKILMTKYRSVVAVGDCSDYSLDKHTEQTKPISTMRLWQKHAARKSTLSCVGTDNSWRMPGGGRKDICVARHASVVVRLSRRACYVCVPSDTVRERLLFRGGDTSLRLDARLAAGKHFPSHRLCTRLWLLSERALFANIALHALVYTHQLLGRENRVHYGYVGRRLVR